MLKKKENNKSHHITPLTTMIVW